MIIKGGKYIMFESYPDIMSINDLQEALGISRNSVIKLLDTGQIKYIRIGRLYKVSKLELIDYINRISIHSPITNIV
jgi:excisionase family DNA binding protein